MVGDASFSSFLSQQRHTEFSWLYLVMEGLPMPLLSLCCSKGRALLCLHSCDIGKGQETALLAKKLLEASTFKAWKARWGKLCGSCSRICLGLAASTADSALGAGRAHEHWGSPAVWVLVASCFCWQSVSRWDMAAVSGAGTGAGTYRTLRGFIQER